jgi:DNA polymerase-3 subunit gamma/tau
MLARIERLERVENIAPSASAPKKVEPASPVVPPEPRLTPPSTVKEPDPADYVSRATAEAVREVIPEKASKQAEALSEAKGSAVKSAEPAAKIDSIDVSGLRRMWPEVIENVKKRRRLTWSLLSASAQILGVDDKNITIGIVNAGARDSFLRSESDAILRDAFIEIVGLDRKIEVTVDPSIDTSSTPEARAQRTTEAPTDKTQLSGAALLAAELGATVISETKHK